MSTNGADAFQGLERQRLQLEENIAKLRDSLKTWKTWEWEYESLKEEISAANSPSSSQMREIGRDLGGKLVNEKEVEELLGKGCQPKRTANQVLDMISRRVDYVQQNITTVEKQLNTAEKKFGATDILLQPDMENEEGLPLMDIQEELDEDGNVISSEVFQPGKAAPELVEALKKSGVKAAELKKASEGKNTASEPPSTNSASTASNNGTQTKATSSKPATPVAKPSSGKPAPTPPKKSVSFAEDTKPNHKDEQLTGREALKAYGYNPEISSYNFDKGTKVIELDEDDNEIASYPIIPQGESEEDAALRRQMLQYGLSEVGQVVAEMDLDDPNAEFSDEDEDDYDGEYDSEISEPEDKFGRSTRVGVTEAYRKEMLELEKKLNARMLENVGPQPDMPLAEHADDLRSIQIRKDAEFDSLKESASKATKSEKKGVKFADDLDISPAPQPIKESAPATISKPAPFMSDVVGERTSTAAQSPAEAPSKPAKVSRFQSARQTSAQPTPVFLPNPPVPEQTVPPGPRGQPIASTVVEHEAQPTDPQAPDELDPAVINREVQVEYHKLRNKLIQQQGGFKPSEEDAETSLVEEVDGKQKKVSRFRAARLKADGLQ